MVSNLITSLNCSDFWKDDLQQTCTDENGHSDIIYTVSIKLSIRCQDFTVPAQMPIIGYPEGLLFFAKNSLSTYILLRFGLLKLNHLQMWLWCD